MSDEAHPRAHALSQGVAWMLERELNPDRGQLPPFWCQRLERGHDVFFNSITNSSQPTRPECEHACPDELTRSCSRIGSGF